MNENAAQSLCRMVDFSFRKLRVYESAHVEVAALLTLLPWCFASLVGHRLAGRQRYSHPYEDWFRP